MIPTDWIEVFGGDYLYNTDKRMIDLILDA